MESIDVQHAIIVGAAGIFAGIVNTIAGGGSLITFPLLIFLGLPSAVANGTNRLSILFGSLSAVYGYKSKGVFVFPYGIWLGIAATLGAIVGAKISIDIRGETFNRILAVVMILVVLNIVFNPFKKLTPHAEDLSGKKQWVGIIAFLFVGFYGGFIQAGVGFIIIATLTSINGLDLVKTNSIKALVVFIYTIAAFAVFILDGKVNWWYGLILSTGNVIGSWVVSRWSVEKGGKLIKPVLLVMVIIMAVKLWFDF